MSKRTFFGISIACMLAGVLPLQAQNDAPAFKDSCEWSVSRYKFRTIGDTVKEGITYLKVYRDMDDSAFIFDESRATLYALMRYDAPAKRLYGLDPADSVTKEFLMYDFSMKEGDTIDIVAYKRSFDGGNTHLKAICTSSGKDSVTLLNGEKRAFLRINLINLDRPWDQDPLFESRWAEGIGSNYGLFSPDYGGSYGCSIERKVLLCYAEKGETLLELPENDNDGQKGDCFNKDMGMRIGEITGIIPVTVRPNPASSQISVECEAELQSIRIYDLLGKVVLQRENLSQPELDVSNLPGGMYILQVRTVDGKSMNARFVKEE